MRSKVHDPYQSLQRKSSIPKTHHQSLAEDWKTPGDELYQTIEFMEGSHRYCAPKAQGMAANTSLLDSHLRQRPRLRHHARPRLQNAESPDYLHLLANGILWSCDKLKDSGQPKSGYAAAK